MNWRTAPKGRNLSSRGRKPAERGLNVSTGPEGAEAVRRFVNFHLNDVKLAELMDEFVEQKRPIQGYTPPPVVASELRAIADRIDASKNPDRTLVASAIRKVLFVLK